MTNKEVMYKEFAEHFSEENTKLKAKIEEYKLFLATWNNANNELLKYNQELKDANAKLREENAELKKLIPRICETCKYEDLMGTEEPCESCKHCSSWKMKIGGRINEQTNRI